jgi:hypothetical protein
MPLTLSRRSPSFFSRLGVASAASALVLASVTAGASVGGPMTPLVGSSRAQCEIFNTAYGVSSSTSAATSVENDRCGQAKAKLKYTRNGKTYWTGWVTKPRNASIVVPAGGRGTEGHHDVQNKPYLYKKNFSFTS